MKHAKEIFVPTVILFLICAVTTLLLSVTNSFTSGAIAQRQADAQKESMAKVLPADRYERKTISQNGSDAEYHEAYDKSGTLIGYVFDGAANGYGGEVIVMTGIRTNGTISAIDVVACDNETPGLGQNAKNEGFTGQFADHKGSQTVVKGQANDENQIDAITGATITSKAVVSAVNQAVELFEKIKG